MVRIAATVAGADLAPGDRIDAEHDRDVVDDRAQDRDGEPPAVAQRHVQRDQRERDEDREDRAVEDLPAEARGHVLDAERLGVDVLVRPFVSWSCCGRAELLEADLEALVRVGAGRLAAALDDRVAAADRGSLVAHLRQRHRLRRLERDLHAALEVDAEVQSLDRDRDDAQADGDERDDEVRAGGA